MASYEETLVSISLDADASLAVHTNPPHASGVNPSGVQYRFVQVVGDHEAGLFTNATGTVAVGVLQNKPQEVGEAAQVAVDGISLVEAGGAITAGDTVGSDADGKATTGGDLGIALYGAAATDELIPVLLRLHTTAVA